jgi:hypothetical protein
MHAADAMVVAVPEVRAADLAIRSDIKNQEVSAARKLAEQPRSLSGKDVSRANKKSRRQGSWPSNQEVSVARMLAEQTRSLGGKEVGRATKKSWRQGSWPSNQEVSAERNLAEQPRSHGSKIWPCNQEVSAARNLAEQPKSLRTMKRVFGPRKESHDQVKSLRTIKVESPSDYKS